MSLIFLIGMPGAGKSYQAKLLSEHYGYHSIDLDEYVEKSDGKKISDIFSEYGEAYFRQLETRCLEQIIDNNKDNTLIVACGGGTPAFGNNMQLMKKNGCVVYLEIEMSIIAERVNKVAASRPVLASGNVTEVVLGELYTARRHWYEQADFILKTNEVSIANFDKIIKTCTGRL